jgi:hypothetical protein
VQQLDALLFRGTQVQEIGEEAEDRFVDAAYEPAINRDPEHQRCDALRNRFHIVQRIGDEGDIDNPAAVDAAGNLVGTPEVPLEHQLAAARDQNRVHVSGAREPISHPAQRVAIDELIVIDGGERPAVVSRDRNTAALRRIRVHRQGCEWCQRSSPEKRNKPAPSHAVLAFTRFAGAKSIR